jgi:DNA-binding LacI/PurR family transcriptional regulator
VIVTDLFSEDSRIAVIEELRLPAVIAGGPGGTGSLPYVWGDDAAAMTSVVEYLVALGHRRIARVAGLPSLQHTAIRTAAFQAVTSRHGLTDARVIVTDYSGEEGARATRALLTGPDRPTAITFDNDLMAVAALGVAAELGVAVPDDLSIVAGDDSSLASLVHPPLTALVRDVPAYGALVARSLIDVLAGRAVEPVQHETPHLVPRGSTSRAR